MSPYKNFVIAAKTYLNSNGFLRFLLSAHIAVFALGGLFYLLGIFLVNMTAAGAVSIYDTLTCLGVVLMWAGLLLSLVAEDPMTIVIASGSVSVCSLIAWIVLLARRFPFLFEPLFYFLVFGAVCVITAIKAEKFVKMRAASAARSSGYACPRCGGLVPATSAFCPTCGAPSTLPPNAPLAGQAYAPPAGQAYAPPAGQAYAPPAGQPYAPLTGQPYAPPAGQPYAPPAGQPYAPPPPFMPAEPPAQEAPAQPIAPAAPEPSAAEPSAAPEAAAASQCVSCGAALPPGAVFCGKCGTRQ